MRECQHPLLVFHPSRHGDGQGGAGEAETEAGGSADPAWQGDDTTPCPALAPRSATGRGQRDRGGAQSEVQAGRTGNQNHPR